MTATMSPKSKLGILERLAGQLKPPSALERIRWDPYYPNFIQPLPNEEITRLGFYKKVVKRIGAATLRPIDATIDLVDSLATSVETMPPHARNITSIASLVTAKLLTGAARTVDPDIDVYPTRLSKFPEARDLLGEQVAELKGEQADWRRQAGQAARTEVSLTIDDLLLTPGVAAKLEEARKFDESMDA